MEDNKYNVVMYTDGSCIGLHELGYGPGHIGSGMHGFLYTDNVIGKPTKDLPTGGWTITKSGYYLTDEIRDEHKVTPTHYINGIYAIKGVKTNNVAEVEAIRISIDELLKLEHEYKKIIVKTDSRYAMFLYEENIEKIQTNSEMQGRKNEDLWFLVRDQVKILKEKNIELKLLKVKGHSGIMGNDLVDALANTARINSEKKNFGNFFSILDGKKYWKPNIKKDPFLTVGYIFFTHSFNSTKVDNSLPKPYVIMEYPTEKELGMNTNKALLGLVYKKELNKDIEEIISTDKEVVGNNYILSEIEMKTFYGQQYNKYNEMFDSVILMTPNKRKSGVDFISSSLTTPVFQGLAKSIFNKTIGLEDTYLRYLNYKFDNKEVIDNIYYTDITDLIFSKNEKDKVICHLATDVKTLDTIVNIGENKTHKASIVLGIETLHRNTFKKIEKSIVRVMVEAIVKNKQVFLNTIVDAGDDIGVYTNFFTSKIVLK